MDKFIQEKNAFLSYGLHQESYLYLPKERNRSRDQRPGSGTKIKRQNFVNN